MFGPGGICIGRLGYRVRNRFPLYGHIDAATVFVKLPARIKC